MKDVVSLVITTSCLAVVGLGIYFFTSNKDENDKTSQKGGKKISNTPNNNTKKPFDTEDAYQDDYNKIDEHNEPSEDDYDEYHDYTPSYKSNTRTKSNNKTKKNKNKLSTSKKRYY